MRKRICVLLFAAIFTVGLASVRAGGDHGQKMDVASHVAKLKAELNLTDQQAEKVKAVFEDIHKRKMALKAQATDQKAPEVQEQYKKLMEEQDTRLKEILTAEQLTKYQQIQTQHATNEQTEHRKPQ
jgi:L-fucose mutarotase/ribose pyranase (RbsD/FucU family)